MKPVITARTQPLQGRELLGALEQLQGVPASRVLRVCGYVMRTGKGQRRRRPRAFVRAVVQARGAETGIDNRSLATVVRWACLPDQPKKQKPTAKSLLRPDVMALTRQGIEQYHEALIELAR
jgi:hypothetical protein